VFARHGSIHFGFRAVIVILSSCLIVTGCAKLPDKLVTPTLKIETAMKDNQPVYKLLVNTGIQNENSDTALINVKGNIFFLDAGKAEKKVMTIPFELPIILPFDTGIIELEKTYTEKEIEPLLALMGSNKDKLQSDKNLERSFVDDKNIGFELTAYGKKNILDVLREKVNEKN
jgi:hypothetical protein